MVHDLGIFKGGQLARVFIADKRAFKVLANLTNSGRDTVDRGRVW